MGELNLAVGALDLAGLAAEGTRRVLPLARERGVELVWRGEEKPLTVEADPDRLQQVLLILLDNALKHTPPGGKVTVAARRGGQEAHLEVADTGEGIPARDLPRVFDRFYRADRARSRDSGGAGLGLALARSLVEAHRGHLSLRSQVGVGTTVTIRLPLSP
jgi:signal transduction histidine kinase